MQSVVLHVITNLSSGGAERMLFKLLAGRKSSSLSPVVLSLVEKGYIGEQLERSGIEVHTLEMKRNAVPTPALLGRLKKLMDRIRPAAIQGWMYHANLTASLAALTGRKQTPVLWNVRHSLHDLNHEPRLTRLAIQVGAKFSAHPAAIIYNAQASARQHEALGYRRNKSLVIPNGFNVKEFQPDAEQRTAMRRELGVDEQTFVVGIIGRYHPMKDHKTFIEAAGRFKAKYPRVRFVLAGDGISWENKELVSWLDAANVRDTACLLGERRDIPRLLNGLDVLTSCSAWGEGFPNIIGEACSCGVPCVVTDIGDSARIVADQKLEVEIGNPLSLSDRWIEMLKLGSEGRRQVGQQLRRRVVELYALDAVVEQYEEIYEKYRSPLPTNGYR